MAVAATAGAVTLTVTGGSSSGASNSVSVRANIDLGQAVAELVKLGFAGSDNIQNSGSNSSADCVRSATKDVRNF